MRIVCEGKGRAFGAIIVRSYVDRRQVVCKYPSIFQSLAIYSGMLSVFPLSLSGYWVLHSKDEAVWVGVTSL
jgi:hypothetical protein